MTARTAYHALLLATFPPAKVASLIRRVGAERARQQIGAHPKAWKELTVIGHAEISAALKQEAEPVSHKVKVRGSPAGTKCAKIVLQDT